ncbi:MAG: serine/threonine protein kinase, partial [bacterium]|nr:serine/threonine protein kinase [bacterium]
MSLPLARIDDQYDIVAKIKKGGMGEIYKVRHRLLDELRVVKVLHPNLVGDSELNERFAREARAAIQLRHPNIVQIFDFTLDDSGAGLIVMEYIRGTDLKQLIARSELPSIALVVEIARQGLRALGYLHRHGFVHRDVSPDNLMLSVDVEGRPLVKIIDLGIAKRRGSDPQLTASGMFLGKFRYASPEHFGAQGSGGIEARSDLYTFGLVLYELLTGQYPIRGESTSQLIAGHLFQPPRDFSETDPGGRIPAPLRQLVLKTLAKEPTQRFANAEELIACIGDLRADYPVNEAVLEESRSFTTGEAPRAVSEPAAISVPSPTVTVDAEAPQDPLERLVT